VKPFIILALPRTGTKAICDSIASHPDIPFVYHEFNKETEDQFDKTPCVLSNYVKPWMARKDIVKVHIYREDSIAGAVSMLTLHYNFPDQSYDIPENEIIETAQYRQRLDQEMREVADWSVSYESLCGDSLLFTELPRFFVERFCTDVGIPYHPMPTAIQQKRRSKPRNYGELQSLTV